MSATLVTLLRALRCCCVGLKCQCDSALTGLPFCVWATLSPYFWNGFEEFNLQIRCTAGKIHPHVISNGNGNIFICARLHNTPEFIRRVIQEVSKVGVFQLSIWQIWPCLIKTWDLDFVRLKCRGIKVGVALAHYKNKDDVGNVNCGKRREVVTLTEEK